jgi:hypothetical protein
MVVVGNVAVVEGAVVVLFPHPAATIVTATKPIAALIGDIRVLVLLTRG